MWSESGRDTMEQKQDNFEISFVQIVQMFLRRWWVIAVCVIVGAGLFLGYAAFFVTPLYKATAMMYVNNGSISVGSIKASITTGDLSAAQSLIDTYGVILKSRLTLESVIEKAELNYSYEKLKSMISSQSVNGTEIFSITVTGPNPGEACKIANTIVEVLPEQISGIVEGSTVRTVDLAVKPARASSPSYSRYTFIGIFFGLAFGMAIILLAEFLNDTIRSDGWIRQTFGDDLPILTVIPDIDSRNDKKYGYGYGYGPKPSSDNN